MKRWLRIGVPLLLVALIGLVVMRAVNTRKAEQARLAATPPAPAALELAPDDVITLRR